MPKNVVSFQYAVGTNPYVSDINQNLSINSRFVAPPDLDDAGITAILAAVGGTLTTEAAICSDSALGTPRKLEFIRKSGNSMSVAVAARTALVSAATTIKGVLDPLNGGTNPVVCIKLYGEEFLNLNDELGLSYDGTTFATSHKAPATALKQNFVTGSIAYGADAAGTFGESTIIGIRSITEAADNTFAAQLGTTPATCIGNFLDLQNCGNGRRNPRKHRRFMLTFATKADPTDATEGAQTETIELPVKDSAAADILTCGSGAAGLTGLYCIGYKGESHSRFHKFLP